MIIKQQLTESEQIQVAEILRNRANEIATFLSGKESAGRAVYMALTREIDRLRTLANKLSFPEDEQ